MYARSSKNRVNFLSLPAQNNMPFYSLNNQNIPEKMKNKFLTAVLFLIIAIAITSCYSSRKAGCPTNMNSNAKFKG